MSEVQGGLKGLEPDIVKWDEDVSRALIWGAVMPLVSKFLSTAH